MLVNIVMIALMGVATAFAIQLGLYLVVALY